MVTLQARTSVSPCSEQECTADSRLELRLLDGFELAVDERPIPVQPNEQRLLAFVALHRRPVLRPYVASMLWTDSPEQSAQASLRSALWRLRQVEAPVVEAINGSLALGRDVGTDVQAMTAEARRLFDCDAPLPSIDRAVEALRGQLLPGWCDDWVLAERERLRQLQLHALDRLAERLLAAGRIIEALEAAMTAVAAEPLRESGQRLVIMAHLAEGNRSEALRQYRECQQLLEAELGVAPSPRMRHLVDGFLRNASTVPGSTRVMAP